MIEVVYNGEAKRQEAPEGPDGRTLKNIRQIGKNGGSVKLYVEDSAMRFLQRCIRQADPPVLALLGSERADGETASLFVNGAILAKKIEVHGNRLEFAADAFTDVYGEAAAYFAGSTILGWFLPSYEAIGRYADVFGETSRLFLLEDAAEREALFYVRRQKRLTRLEGYYIYYQNNEQMQQYRQKCEREEATEPTKKETEKNAGLSRAAAENKENLAQGPRIRLWNETRKAKRERPRPADDYDDADEAAFVSSADEQPHLTTFLYAVSTVLAIVILVIGIAMIGSYERMYEMQETIETIAGSIVNGVLPTQTPQADNSALSNETSGLSETEAAAETQMPVTYETSDVSEGDDGADASGMAGSSDIPDAGSTADMSDGFDVSESAAEPTELLTAYEDGTVTTDGAGTILYTVQKGDTLAAISRRFYRTEEKVEQILAANTALSKDMLTAGEKIILP